MAGLEGILRRGVSRTVLLALTRRRFPGCSIDSVRIEPGARLAEHVRVAHDAEIRSNVSIGRWTYIEPYSFVNGADIGSFCAIGRNVAIGCFQHPYDYPASSAKMYRDLPELEHDDLSRPVSIGSDVWIGEGAIVLGDRSRCRHRHRCRRDPRRRAVLERGGGPGQGRSASGSMTRGPSRCSRSAGGSGRTRSC